MEASIKKQIMNTTMRSSSSRECAKVLKALAEEIRLQILHCLFRGEYSVSEIAKEIGKKYSKVSHHRVLRNAGLVADKKERKFVIYQIHPAVQRQFKGNEYKNALDFKCCCIGFRENMDLKES
jgi:DNA-binding transcriptional ArsR family regulator